MTEEHFYHTPHKTIYKAFTEGVWLESDIEQKKYNVDTEAFYSALMTQAFSALNIPPTEKELLELKVKRDMYTKAQELMKQSLDMSVDVNTSECEDGYEEFMQEAEMIGEGEFSILDTPFPKLNIDSRFTEGKSICFIVGEPGAGKSFFMTQLTGWLSVVGVKNITWMAENNKQFHARRSIAQYIGDSHLCDYEWLSRNIVEAKKIYEANKSVLDGIMSSIYSAEELSKEALVKWCWAKAKEGYRVIGCDPLTYFSGGDKVSADDQWIMTELNEIIKKYVVTFIIVTHPRNSGGAEISLDNIAGSRNLSRFCQNAIWISRKEDGEANRVMYTLKTRNGQREFGGKIDMHFSRETARFEEM